MKRISIIFSILLLCGGIFFGYFWSQKAKTVTITDELPWFNPALLEIETGDTVKWELKAAVVHPIMSIEAPESIRSGHFSNSWSYTFHTPGIYVYICPIHPYMKGIIGVDQKIPEEKIPIWVKEWPPANVDIPGGIPTEKGSGEVWVATQFEQVTKKEKPGTITIVNAETWEVEAVLDDPSLNNPHNLWQVGKDILVTNWFDKFLSIFDKNTKKFLKKTYVGESVAHIHAHGDHEISATVQGEDAMALLNQDYEVSKKVRAPTGPHGHWMSADGKLMALASTEDGSFSLWDATTQKMLFTDSLGDDSDGHGHNHTLPLMAGITLDSKYSFVATSGTGDFYVYDNVSQKRMKKFHIGNGPIQTVPSPDGKYVFVPLTYDSAVAVISTETWELTKVIENVGLGAHGVYFGEKQNGGWYAYISNKFTNWLTVIDLEKLEIAGYVPLGENAWGGQGVLVVEE